MIAKAILAALKRFRRFARDGRSSRSRCFLYATGGPAVFAGSQSPMDFILQQGREQADQAAKAKPVQAPRAHKPVRDFVPSEATRAPGDIGGTPIAPTFFINVLGDSLAVYAADGLTQAFADKPEISVINRAREASGLVRDDYFDWPKIAHDVWHGQGQARLCGHHHRHQ